MPGSLLRLSLRGLLAWCLLSLAGILCLRPVVTAMIPLVEGVVDAAQSDYVPSLNLVVAAADTRLVMSCTLTHRLIRPGESSLPPLSSFACAWIGAIDAMAPVVAFLVPIVAWPLHRRGESLARVLMSMFSLIGVIALTTPVVLLSLARQSLYPEAFGQMSPLHQAVHLFILMENGGNWLIALTAAALTIRAGLALSARWDPGADSGGANETARALQRRH